MEEQEGFRFRNDDGSESAATWKAAQDTNITLPADSSFRLRILIDTTKQYLTIASEYVTIDGKKLDIQGDESGIFYQLEYRHKPSGGSFGSWKKIASMTKQYLTIASEYVTVDGEKINIQ